MQELRFPQGLRQLQAPGGGRELKTLLFKQAVKKHTHIINGCPNNMREAKFSYPGKFLTFIIPDVEATLRSGQHAATVAALEAS